MTEEAFNIAASTPQEKGRELLEEAGRTQPDVWKMSNLILGGAEMEQRNAEGLTPLLVAVKQNSTQAALLLIEAGADLGATDRAGDTPLMHAERHDNLKVFMSLRRRRAPSRGFEGFITGEMWDRHMDDMEAKALAQEARETTFPVFGPYTLKTKS